MRTVASLAAVALISVTTACGGDDGGDGGGSADEEAAKAAMLEWFRASAERDVETVCAALTENAVAEIADGSDGQDCEGLYSGVKRTSKPVSVPEELVGPIGADDGFAIAVVRVGDIGEDSREENLLYRMREDDGRWKVDSILPIPTAEDLADDSEPSDEAAQVLSEYTAALEDRDAERACELLTPEARRTLTRPPKDFPGATYGPERKPLSEFTPCEWHAEWAAPDADEDPSYEDVVAVGDLALGYPGDGPPTVLVRTPDGWRVEPVSLGVP